MSLDHQNGWILTCQGKEILILDFQGYDHLNIIYKVTWLQEKNTLPELLSLHPPRLGSDAYLVNKGSGAVVGDGEVWINPYDSSGFDTCTLVAMRDFRHHDLSET